MITESDVEEMTLSKHKWQKFSFKLGLKLSDMLKVSQNIVFQYRNKSLLKNLTKCSMGKECIKHFKQHCYFFQQIFARSVNLSISKSVRYSVFKDSEVKRRHLYPFFLTQYSSYSKGFLWCLTIVESFTFTVSFNIQFRISLLWKQRVT